MSICVSDDCCCCLSVSCTRASRLGFEIGIGTSTILYPALSCTVPQVLITNARREENEKKQKRRTVRVFSRVNTKNIYFSSLHRFASNSNLSSFIPLTKSPFFRLQFLSLSFSLPLAHMSCRINYAPFFHKCHFEHIFAD